MILHLASQDVQWEKLLNLGVTQVRVYPPSTISRKRNSNEELYLLLPKFN